MIVKNEAEMLAFGRDLAGELKAGDWLAIDGPLGAGKTVLCRGILQGLGFTGEVTSPLPMRSSTRMNHPMSASPRFMRIYTGLETGLIWMNWG